MAGIEAGMAGLVQRATFAHGVFTTEDLVASSVSDDLLRSRLRSGEWQRVHRGVYRIAGNAPTFRQQVLAAVRFNGPEAVASHRAAARLWGVPGFGRSPVEVSKPRGRSQRRSYGLVHGSLVLPSSHVTTQDGIPVTDPARTAFDLAGVLHPLRAGRAIDDLLARGLLVIGRLEVVFAELARRGRRGTAVMRELLEARGEGYVAPTSELEALGRRVLADAGLPEPRFEVDLGDEAWVGRVDLLFDGAKLVIELDSRRHHTVLSDHASDRRRDNRLMAAGWRVLRFTWWDLVERPGDVVTQVRAALGTAA